MSKISAGQFPVLYQALNLVPDDAECVMIDAEPIEVLKHIENGEDDLYYSTEKQYVQGVVADHKAHITLLFGLLVPPVQLKHIVDLALEGWKQPKTATIEKVGFFPGDGYSCIVAHIAVDEALQEGHDRLRLIPHIDTFPEYKPHLTLAYVKEEATTEWIESLSFLKGQVLTLKPDLNYGD